MRTPVFQDVFTYRDSTSIVVPRYFSFHAMGPGFYFDDTASQDKIIAKINFLDTPSVRRFNPPGGLNPD